MIKVGDIVQFYSRHHKSGKVLLVGADCLLVRVDQGKGHNGYTVWTKALGWRADETNSCWVVPKRSAIVVKNKPSFKGNIK